MPASMPLFNVIVEVIRHTPHWVWAVLALLVVLGSLHLRAQHPARLRVALLPLALGCYSLWGAVSLFGLHSAVLLAWALGVGLTACVSRRFVWSQGIRHEPASDRFALPGSVWPLVLMLTVFAVRYSVVVTLVFHPDWAGDMGFAAGASAVYGMLSGLLAGRALYILGHARPTVQRRLGMAH
jgi:hypothetical protein